MTRNKKQLRREVVAIPWERMSSRPPFRAAISQEHAGQPMRPGGSPVNTWSYDWKCRHRHRSLDEAFACGKARLAKELGA